MPTLAANDDNSDLMKLCNEIAQGIYNSKAMPAAENEQLLHSYAAKLVDALMQGFETGESAEDTRMLHDLTLNVYQFSAAKDYAQMKALTEALLDEDGKLRTWPQFRRAAFEINDMHVNQWLKAEYENAVACSQMASKWQQFEGNSATLPMLKYVTAEDDRVRPAHAAMDGIVRPLNDIFWARFFPPNGWNCRCDVQQGNWPATAENKVYYPTDKEVPPLFQFNAGKERMAFPPNHPYFDGCPPHVIAQGTEAFKTIGTTNA